MNRKERAEKYCCLAMWSSVEIPEDNKLRLGFGWFRVDSGWSVRNFNVSSGKLMISYCPWCGCKLPNKPFIDKSHESQQVTMASTLIIKHNMYLTWD